MAQKNINDHALADASTSLAEEPELPQKTIWTWLAFVPAALLFIALLIVFEVMQLVCAGIGPRAARWSRDALQYGFYYYLYALGSKIHFEVPEELDAQRPYILVSNHQSMFDIPLLFVAFRSKSPRYIAKVELGRGVPTISRYLRTDGSALIERDNPRQALPAIQALAERARAGNFAVSIFPEGTRARNGRLKRFRLSGLKMLLRALPEAVVLPVAIDGSWMFTCYPRGPVPLGVAVDLRAGRAIERSEKSAEEIVAEAERQVETMLREIRAQRRAHH